MMDPDSSSDSNRDTPKELGEVITRPDTPGPMPTYHYPRDTLFELQFCPLAKKRPACLSEEFNTIDGLWDPDRWSRSFDTSRNNSPLTVGDRDKKRMEIQIERDYLMRRRPSADPKERLKEEKDGIVLSPQRRSFGTGCHVTQPTLTRQISCPSDFKDGSDRDRGPRRIGSGRIQLDRDRGEVTRERGGGERDFRAIRDRFDRDDRDRDRRYDREWEREGRDSRESRDPRDRGFRGGFDDRDSRRDFGNRHFTSRDVRRKDFHQEDEPEWFTEGPISQQDTIELRGFEREKEKETPRQIKEVEEEDADESAQEEHKTGVADVADRNGSLETNEPSSPEESNHSDSMRTTSPHNNIFDFNEFFKIDNLPGLNQEGPVASADIPVVQSRFSQWFGAKPGGSLNSSRHNSRHNSHHNSRHNSRRSSLNDDFGYIVNDLLGGTRSPNVASPPPDQPMFDQSVFSPANSTFADKPQHHSIDFTGLQNKEAIAPMLSAIFQNNHEKHQLGSTSSNFSTQDAEIQLKALLFGKKDSTPSSGTASPGMGSPLNVPGRAKTVAELEADMNQRSSRLPARCFTPPQQPVPPPDMPQNFQRQPPTQPQQQQVPAHFQPPPPELSHTPQYQSPPGHQQMTPHNLPVQQQMHPQEMSPQEIQQQLHQHLQQQQQMQPQPLTPQQMQAHLAQQQHPSMPQVSIHQSAHSTPRGSQDEGDLTAFNKLLSLMKAGAAAAVESPPKIVGRPGQAVSPPPHMAQPPAPMSHPPMPPLTNSQAAAAAAQNEFFQALQRNKEQQLQIRHQTMNQMRIQQKPIPSQQLQTPPAQMSQPQGNQNNSGQPVNDPIINFIKQNPTIITKPASPTPPPQGTPQPPQTVSSMMGMMQTTSTPRAPSPSAGLMGQNLLSQPPSSPRIASPITSLFGQQPPMHLSAPSPINPSQMGQSSSITVPAGTTLTSTATIRPPVVPRVPSPQELIAHTQAIMQTALLKKQLEDQRERFIRKQQDSVSYRAKSPNPMVSVKPAGPNVTQTPTMSLATSPACQTPKPSVSAAFTPTSVMKKMHSDKASEKEKQRQDNGEGENASDNGGPVKQLIQQDTSHTAVDNLELIQKMNIEQQAKENLPATIMTSMTTHCQPSSMPTSQFSNHDMNIPGINSIAASLAGHHDSVSLAEQLSQLSTPTSVQPKQQARALIGNGGFQGTPGQPVSGPVATPGRPIVKGITITSSSAVSSVMTPPMGRPMIGVPQMSTPQLQSKTVEGTPISLQTPSQPHLHRAITGAANPTSVPQVQTPVVPQQKQFSVSPSPLTRPIPPMGAQYGIPITGRIPVQQAMSPNPLLMQQMIQSGISPTAAARVNALNQLNQINHMNHLAMQQQQPRIMDPRLQGMRGVYPTVPNLTPRSSVIPTSLGVPVRTPMGVNVAIGRTVSPHPPTQKLINGPVSPGIPIHTSIPTSLLNGNNNITKQDPNLAKWFGTDVLKQQMTSLPPLPGSGQRMMTLEEIERCQQQAVIN